MTSLGSYVQVPKELPLKLLCVEDLIETPIAQKPSRQEEREYTAATHLDAQVSQEANEPLPTPR